MKRFAPFHDRYPRELVALVESKKWSAFTAIQEQAIKALSINPKIALPDAILEAETSSGKTEAVFLPLLARARAARQAPKNGFSILYISPLRALINDQEGRIGAMAGVVGLAVHPWHSDVEAKKKDKARRDRNGILLTTPESIEGFFLRAGHERSEIDDVARVSAIVIDELHAFFDTARGRHLQSLLHRLDVRANAKIPRLGLSATLSGIDDSACEVLRPKSEQRPLLLRPTGQSVRKVTIGIKVFIAGDKNARAEEEAAGNSTSHLNDQFAQQLLVDFEKDARGLVFCNSRAGVETLQERAKVVGDPRGLLFEAHHSSVGPKQRKSIEERMRQERKGSVDQMVVICTNTLELGIDIGQVQRVVQIDPTYTVAALRQRVGRSGRRGDAGAEGLIYIGERSLTDDAHPLDRLRIKTFQAIATAQLALEGFFEEPNHANLHLSTLYHQIISVLREGQPKTAQELHKLLVLDGPWHSATPVTDFQFFSRFLETMTETQRPSIERTADGEWRLQDGEEVPRPAYAVFSTPPEYAVYFAGTLIGNLPMTIAYRVGDTFVLRAGRWRVLSVNDANHSLTVAKAPSAGAPRYGGAVQSPSGLVAGRMKAIYEGEAPSGLSDNELTARMLREGRRTYKKFELNRNRFLEHGRDVVLFPWCGSRKALTLVLALRREGLKASIENFAITVESCTATQVKDQLKAIKRQPLPDPDELAREARQLQFDRFDRYLIPYHQRVAFSGRFLALDGLGELIDDLLAGRVAAG
jgi:ATP-dependent Lhr-like helicase